MITLKHDEVEYVMCIYWISKLMRVDVHVDLIELQEYKRDISFIQIYCYRPYERMYKYFDSNKKILSKSDENLKSLLSNNEH